MRIKTRIKLGIILSLVLAMTIVLFLLLGTRAVNEGGRLEEIAVKVIKGAAELKIVTHEYMLHPEERSLMQWRSRYSSLLKLLRDGYLKDSEEKIVADQILKNLERFKTVFFDLITALRKGEIPGKQEIAAFRKLQERLMDELLMKSRMVVSLAFQLHQELEVKLVNTQKRVAFLIIILLLTLTAAIVGILLWVNRSVARPIAKLEKDSQIIGSGNLDHRVGTPAKDEIGELSRAFDKMTQDLKETTTSVVELNKVIDECKQTEGALRESEDRYRELFDNMRGGVAVYEAVDEGDDFIFVDYNHAGEQMDRKNKRDVIGRRVTEVFPGVIEFGLHKVFKRVWKTGKPESHPLSIYKDGDLAEWRESFVYKLPSGEIVAVFTDETTRVKAEEVLRRSEKQASAALEAARAFTFSYDIASGKIEWDGSIEEITGYSPEEFFHVDIEGWAEKIHPDERDDILSILKESVQRDRATAEYRFRTKCGDYIVLASISLTERNEKGLPVRLVGILQDITEAKKIRAEAMRAGHLAALGELAAGVAHEINNPVNGIISYAEILKDEFTDRGEDDDIPTRIIKEGDRVAEIVKNLLVFARDRKEEHSPTHIQDILADALALVERQIAKDGIKLKVDVSPDLPKIKARSQEIQQVFLNIISNARYALNQRFPEFHEDKVFEIRAETLEIEEKNYVRIVFL